MSDALQLCRDLPQESFEEGAVVLTEGQRTGIVHVLIEGEVEILRGDVQVDTSATPGAVFGEMSILLEKSHTATVKTLQPSRFYRIDDLKAFLQSNPAFGVHLCRMLARRLNNVTSYLVDLKEQFSDQQDHLGMVDDVLGTLLHHQDEK